MGRLVLTLLTLYSVALLSSIAALETISVLLTLVAFALFVKKMPSQRWRLRCPDDAFGKVLLAFNGIVFLSFLMSPLESVNYSQGLGLFKITLWFFALRFLMDKYVHPEQLNRFVQGWAGLVLLLSCYTIFQFFTGIDLVRGPGHILEFGPFYRPTGFFSMALTLAYALGMAGMPLMAWVVDWGNQKQIRPLYGLVMVVVVLAMVLSLSRGLWLGLMVSMVYFLWQVRSRKLTLTVLAIAIPIIGVMALNPTIQEKVRLLFDPNAANYYRLTLWKAYGSMFTDHWLIGVGWQQNEALLPQYLQKIGQADFEFRSHAHSNYMQTLAGTGILGFVAFLGLIFLGFEKAFRLQRAPGFLKTFGVGLVLSQLIFHIGGLTECNFTDAELTHMIFSQWALLGFFEKKGFYV